MVWHREHMTATALFAFGEEVGWRGWLLTSLRPPGDITQGWWRLDNFSLTLDAWRSVWTKYPLAGAFWTSFKLTALSTLGTMLLAPAAA